ncbi:hypothetical protein [Brevundimonas viscosa]|uniref:hypothetical protein n=1 Tax=Brevundimonas viscosa TaxID=871741 RepID=UPI001160BCDD|nr:hypothetical protein [Brevundimonas viscosa]
MIEALIAFSLLAAQDRSDFWVVTHADAREATAINVGFAFVPEGQDFVLATAYTVHRNGTAASRWTTPAYTLEFLAFRCVDRTYRLRRSQTWSGVADPVGPHEPDGPFTSVWLDPKRAAQADAVCQPRSNHTEGFRSYFDFMRAYGLVDRKE